MSMTFLFRSFQPWLDTYVPLGPPEPQDEERKKKKKRRVYTIRKKKRSLVAKELDSPMEARRAIQEQMRQEAEQLRAEKKAKQFQEVMAINDILDYLEEMEL